MKLITLYLPETYIKALDQLVDEKFYPNRAEAIRTAIRDLIRVEVWNRKPLCSKSLHKLPEPKDLPVIDEFEQRNHPGQRAKGQPQLRKQI